jgi:hypothetical protein
VTNTLKPQQYLLEEQNTFTGKSSSTNIRRRSRALSTAVAVTLPFMGILVVALYGWNRWETLKEELQKIFEAFADSLAKSFQK